MTDENKTSVAVVGLGRMGAALAAAYVNNGHPTTVWNRSPEKADALVSQGAVRAAGVDDAIAAGEVVIVCVTDYPALHALLDNHVGAFAGKALINLTSGTPEQAREAADWAAGHGIAYLDGAIMATPPLIGQPEAMTLYGGSHEVFVAHEKTLARLGSSTYVGPDAGMALMYDLAMLGIMWSTLGGFLHAVALLGTEKVDAKSFVPVATNWLFGITTFLPELAQQVDDGSYATEVSSINVNAAAIDHLVHASRAQGIGTAVPAPLKALIDQRAAQGHGEESLAGLVELIRKQTPAA
ncbi:MAG: NAD(P)-binding domain-containing protein [Actinoplanes sp.]